MRFLIDAQLPPILGDWLTAQGHSAEHVFAILGGAARDKDVVARAIAQQAVIISKDNDFLMLVPPPPQLLHVTLGNVSNARLKELFDRRFQSCLRLLERGDAVVELGW